MVCINAVFCVIMWVGVCEKCENSEHWQEDE